jgi:ABC-type sugar transport system ATPase subunit
MVEIKLENITHVYTTEKGLKTVALENVNITFPSGKITGILGPSGCGKTTMLKIIAGLLKPTKGRVYFDNRDVTNLDPQQRNVAMVFQFPVAYDMSIYDNIAFPLKLRNISKDTIHKRVMEIVDILGIDRSILNKNAKGVDPGLRQKIAVARALIREADVLLLDEPLTNLEPLVRIELKTRLKEITKTLKITTIYVTHDQAEVLTLAERIAVMNMGRVIQYDETTNVYENPVHEFVGYFIGNPGMNFVECSLNERKMALDCKGFELSLNRDEVETLVKYGTEFRLGIRPEHIYIDEGKSDKGIKGRVSLIERVGTALLIHAEISKEVSLVVKTYKQLVLQEGSIINLLLPKDKIRIFDRKTGNKILP